MKYDEIVSFIRNYLEGNAYYDITYRNEFPNDLEGYQAVFLSFGPGIHQVHPEFYAKKSWQFSETQSPTTYDMPDNNLFNV